MDTLVLHLDFVVLINRKNFMWIFIDLSFTLYENILLSFNLNSLVPCIPIAAGNKVIGRVMENSGLNPQVIGAAIRQPETFSKIFHVCIWNVDCTDEWKMTGNFRKS